MFTNILKFVHILFTHLSSISFSSIEYIATGGDFMLEQINSALCGVVLPISIFLVGIFFAIKLRFFYLLHPLKSAKRAIGASGGFKSLCVALAGTLGVGNIVGVASAITMGGAGAVFWMILSALVAMSVKYAETHLAVSYRRKNVAGYYGGAPYYICDSFKNKRVGLVFGSGFAILCIVNSLSTGNLVQVNSIIPVFYGNNLLWGLALAVLVITIVCGGQGRIEAVCSLVIPALTVLYVILSLYIVFSNFGGLCVAICDILKGAFSFKSAVCGACGFGISSALRYGFSRGLLSNEAGCGTSATAHASSSSDAISQGCLGVFEVFWDTVVLCTLTALVILISGEKHSEPIMLAIASYSHFTGALGSIFIATSCVIFAFATLLCQFFYGMRALEFISSSRLTKGLYSIVFILVCVLSSIISNEVMWSISDFIVCSLALYNMIFLIKLSKKIDF